MLSFYKALFKNPRSVGSIIPSSKQLARAMAACIPKNPSGFVLEIGAGTGVVTRAILQQGVRPQKIIVLEDSKYLATLLLKRFPSIKVIHGNAMNLSELLGEHKNQVHTIVSSLPLLILPENTTQRILEQINRVLQKNGEYIQYTYGFKKSIFEDIKRYEKIHTRRIWFNIPPARIDVFKVK